MEIKELVDIKEREDGNFTINFKVEERTSVDVSLEDLKANKANYDAEIGQLRDQITSKFETIEEINNEIASLNDKKDSIDESLNTLNEFLRQYEEERVVEEAPVEEAPVENVPNEEQVIAPIPEQPPVQELN